MSLNSYNITKLSLVYGLFNQYLFNEAKSNIDLVERYYMTDPSTMDNTLIRALIDAIRKYDFEAIDEPVFKSILSTEKKTDSEAKDILEEIIKYKCYDQKQIDPVRNYLRSICYQSIISQANSRFKNDPQGFVNFLKASDYHADYSNVLSTCSFNDIQISPEDAQLTGGWASTSELINQSYKPLCKWKTGQIAMICMPPGCFTGDTKVRLVNGCSIRLDNLKKGLESGFEYYTYSKRSTGLEVITKIRACWISKSVTELVLVTISGDIFDEVKYIECTGDHKFLTDKGYVPAEDLVRHDVLLGFCGSNKEVVSVEKILLQSPREVYDLNVEDEAHNFLLDSGIYVKNCGKTLFLMNEELGFCLQGARVHHIALGDMKESDFVLRMAAIYSGLPFDQVAMNINVHLANLKKAIGDKLALTCVPSASVTADQYIEYMRSRLNDYDVIAIDYDTRRNWCLKTSLTAGNSYYNIRQSASKIHLSVSKDQRLSRNGVQIK